MVGQHHPLNGHELGQTPGDIEGQGDLARCSPWGHKKSDTNWGLNNSNKYITESLFYAPEINAKL